MIDSNEVDFCVQSTVYEENNGALRLATGGKLSPRTKHLAIKYHFFRESVRNNDVKVMKVDTIDQVSDIRR